MICMHVYIIYRLKGLINTSQLLIVIGCQVDCQELLARLTKKEEVKMEVLELPKRPASAQPEEREVSNLVWNLKPS